MENLFSTPFSTAFAGKYRHGLYGKVALIILIICCAYFRAGAIVGVTGGSGGGSICSNKAVTGSSPAFTTLSPIMLTEGTNADFSAGTDVLILVPPTGWQFSTTLPTITYTGANITGISGSISSTALTINLTVSGVTAADQFTITGLQVQPLTTSAASGYIVASSVSGMAGITTGAGGTSFVFLSVTSPVTASVTMLGTPAGTICSGSNVTFVPTPVNGGSTPVYTWAVNGVDVATGTTYSTSTLSTGATVTCRMLSSLACLTANPVYGNTVTATVTTGPAAVTGSNTICPSVTTTLSTAATGGLWSSSNAAVAIVGSTGVVSGVAPGTARISYTVAGCAATRTVYVNALPFTASLSPTTSTICNGGNITLVAAGTPAPTTILSQNFNGGVAPWVVDTAGSSSILWGSQWKACADSYQNEMGWYRSPDHSRFVLANADTSGPSATLSTRITSPSFSLAPYAAAIISFEHAYDFWPAGDATVSLEISTNGGATWSVVNNFVGSSIGTKMGFVSQVFSLNAYVGNSNVKVRFDYYSSSGFYWALDNVFITGTPAVVVPTWSPATFLFTDGSLTTPYIAGTQTNTVYASPTTITVATALTYTATTTIGACNSNTTAVVNVNPAPGITSGVLNICIGGTTTLTNTSTGGTWASTNISVATVGSTSGIVSSVAAGTATIAYVLGSGCPAVVVITVTPAPATIGGNRNVCLGYTSTLTNSVGVGLGVWTSSNTTVATIGSSTGVVNGLTLGTSTITYSLGPGCYTTAVVTVQPLPAAITGNTPFCALSSITLANTTTGGTWVSASTSLATVGSSSGIVTGVSGGTVNISYVMTLTGCYSLVNVTVNALGPIMGSPTPCLGTTTTLSNVATGGTWLSGNTTVATIGSSSGIVNSLALGTSNITYTTPIGCVSYLVITVSPLPADISGSTTVCIGNNITLSDATTGGTWSSSNTAIANVGSTTGIVNGVSAGPVTITYTTSAGCYKTYAITVNVAPISIAGPSVVCQGANITLTDLTTGGTWSSSNTSIATVGTGGVVTGVAAGTVTISYALGTGCYVLKNITVNPIPATIGGSLTYCQGSTTTFTNTTPAGSWSTSSTAIATIIGSTGVSLGIAPGTVTISYFLSTTGCATTVIATVNPLPAAITGSNTVCTGSSTTLSDATTGGTWSSSNAAIGSIGTGGAVTGVSAGTVTMSYILPTGCYATRLMTVNLTPSAITGTPNVCVGLTTTLSSATAGGTWSSSNTAVGTIVASTGVLTGIDVGTTTISYVVSSGCYTTIVATVLTLPATITGNLNICLGTSSALGNVVSGGTWSSASPSTVSMGSTTGIATGISVGVTTVSYILGTGCYITATAVVNPLPLAISGSATVCVGSSVAYTDASVGGTWSTSDGTVAAVGSSSGLVTGISSGVAVITYTLLTGCYITKPVTVNPVPTAISGPTNICQFATATLTNATSGGTWSSSTLTVATIVSTTGAVTGAGGGVTYITYTLASGCYTVMALTVTPAPAAIAGSSNLCEGNTTLLTNSTAGGTWSSSNISVATVPTGSGLVTGVSAGTATISYILSLGCFAIKNITVNPLPAPITGATSLCMGIPSVLGSASIGGTWSSSAPLIANIVMATGSVTGLALGTAVITYTLSTSCYTTTVVSVNAVPAAISGSTTVCEGATTVYTDITTGGTWASSNTTIATIGSATGIITGISGGSATITYTLSTGCIAIKNITVNSLPAAITGFSAVCQGLSVTTLSSAPGGGTWLSSNTAVATVGAATGIVNGISAGTSNITYTLPTGCAISMVMTVYALPAPLTGPATVCVGSTSTLSTITTGGTWNSGNIAVATIDASGVFSGVSVGTSVITYTLGVGCSVNRTVTVNPLPPAITGNVPTCVGVNVALSNSTAGGTWTSTTSPGVATVSGVSGVVSPVSPGTAVITYTLGTGCYITTVVSVNTVSPILGSAAICAGAVATLTHAITGGTWTSSNPAIASIGVTSGAMIGFSVGTAIISYFIPGGCIATRVATVNALPTAILGSGNVCPGFPTVLTDATPGGTWVSGNVSIATVGSSTGTVTGVAPGTVIISYVMPTGCQVTRVMTVNTTPVTITGTVNICVGNSSTLTASITGGTWSSSNTAIATVGSSTGNVVGIGAGTATITYTPSSGCVATTTATVNSVPVPIAGATSICAGTNTTLTDAMPGGTWTSTNTTVATIGSLSGVVTGLVAGTTTISYSTGVGCAVAQVLTVNVTPSAIAGTLSVCTGYTTNLTSTPIGGTWTSSTLSVATVNVLTGVVSGIAPGTANITYGFATGCAVSAMVTVSPFVSTISGTTVICQGSNTTLTDPASAGGTWTSSNTSIATIGSATGVMTGVSPGTAIITYTIGSGCFATASVTINLQPTAITGVPSACVGMNTTLASTPSGGAWNSSNTAIATVSGSGVVSGVAVGTANITYALASGCNRVQQVTINTTPSTISGVTNVCVGQNTTLSNTVTGGVWSSASTPIATIGSSSGIVNGIAAGSSVISYALGAGCMVTTTVNVLALPLPLTGITSICQGQTTILSSATPGGTWATSNASVATVSGGVVLGVSGGTATITYTISSGCMVTATVTVNMLAPNTGAANTCVGFSTSLSNSVTGGTWSSGNPAVATVVSSGSVTGVAPGTAIITYSLASGCIATTVATVVPLSPITGSSNVCTGLTTTLANTATGGIWTSSNTAIATINPSTGLVTGVAPGTTTISYTFSTGCTAVATMTVNPLPSAIIGSPNVCLGNTTTLSSTTTGGTWGSSNPSVASVTTAGVVTGVALGTATMSYTLSTGCRTTLVVTVNSLPGAITGTLQVCQGLSVILTSTTSGGTWSSGAPAIATVNITTGMVTGAAPGTATIVYTLGTGCTAATVVTVNPLPLAVTGSGNVCVGENITLSDATPGGTWVSGGTATATVNFASGLVLGVTSGTVYISYTLPTGCASTTLLTVNPLPSTIAGTTQVCIGSTISLFNTVPGGLWVSSNTAVATINSGGVASGIAAGTTTISYTLLSGCYITTVLTVNSLPGSLSGTPTVCQGTTTTLTSTSTGGTWNTSSSAYATVSASGVVTGVNPGTATIYYLLPTGCTSSLVVTINALPANITGTTVICAGQTSPLTDAISGGAWGSSASAIAVVDAATGVVTGMMAGTAYITYTLPTGCYKTTLMTVNPSPTPITGASQVCLGFTTTLANATTGGVWSSAYPFVAGISTAGVVNGAVVGTTTISYSLPTGCRATVVFTVNPNPPSITGGTNICPGTSVTLGNAIPGGSWSSTSAFVSVDATTGVVTGVSSGLAVILYTLPTGCSTTAIIMVNPAPAATTGVASACEGANSTLINTTFGGTWVSGAVGIAAVGASSGIVTGLSAGTAAISYVLPTGCAAVRVFTVNPLPSIITGATSACVSTVMALYNTLPGGTWASGDLTVATVNLSTGAVTGIALGTAHITYTLPTGCSRNTTITVNPIPAAITGLLHVCNGSASILANTTPGGSWSSSSASVALIGSVSGIVISSGPGTSTISYSLGTGCATTAVFTVDALAPVTGSIYVCTGDTVTYSNPVPGGTWSSSTLSVASVSTTGVVYGVAAGVAVISYLLPSGCLATQSLTVNALPISFVVNGGGSYCTGGTGVPVGLSGSAVGINYTLYRGAIAVATITGTGAALNYGLQTAGGVYTVKAVNMLTGCTRSMISSVIVTPVSIGPAAVAITTTTGDTVCNGTSVTYTPIAVLGGSAPSYQWFVNTIPVSSAPSYTYSPANGDIIKCTLTSSASCAAPNVASTTMVMAVLPSVLPSVSVTVSPNDTVCTGTTTSFAASYTNGGISPLFMWKKNGVLVGSGTSFGYIPANGDVIRFEMVSNARCRMIDTAISSNINMVVESPQTPSVTINATPGFTIVAGTDVLFTAIVANAGASPTYQWKINGAAIGGATGTTFHWSSFANNDTISCTVTNNGPCGNIGITAKEVMIVQGVGIHNTGNHTTNLTLLPNPNTGEFSIKGKLNTLGVVPVRLQVTDMLGQVVFEKEISVKNGIVDETVSTANTLSNGMYMLNLRTAENNYTFHFAVRR